MVRHHINKENDKHEIAMGYVEYLATLVSPHPKETIKAIEIRHKHSDLAKQRAGEDVEKEFRLFHEDHRNTTFFDEIAKEGGSEALSEMKKFFGEDADKNESVELYQPKAEDIEFIEKAIQKAAGEANNSTGALDMDTIEF